MLAVTGSAYVIAGIVQGAGDVAELTLDSVQGGAKLLVKASGSAVKASGAAVGASVQVTATASGTLLVTSGRCWPSSPTRWARRCWNTRGFRDEAARALAPWR